VQHEATEIARYGDLIEVTNPKRVDFGKRMQVATAGDIAVTALDNRIRVTIDHEDYTVVRRCGHPATSSAPAKVVKKAVPAPYIPPAIELKATKVEPTNLSVRIDRNGYVAGVSVEPRATEEPKQDKAEIESQHTTSATDEEVEALCRAFDSVKVDAAAPAPITQEQIDAAVEHLRPLYGPAEEPDPLPALALLSQDEIDERTTKDETRDDKVDALAYAPTYAELVQFDRQQRAEKPSSILDEAAKIVDGDREQTYGDPGRNLRTIARYWSAHLSARHSVAVRLDPDDIALMMVALKLARLANDTTHRDSQIDACGYMRLLERVQTEGKA
jgi:hypothetical protein